LIVPVGFETLIALKGDERRARPVAFVVYPWSIKLPSIVIVCILKVPAIGFTFPGLETF